MNKFLLKKPGKNPHCAEGPELTFWTCCVPGPGRNEHLDEEYVSDEVMKAVKRNDSFQKVWQGEGGETRPQS